MASRASPPEGGATSAMKFTPPRCPNDTCPSNLADVPFLHQRRGFYRRDGDGRRVQRYLCKVCDSSFSTQTFRVDRGWRIAKLHLAVARDLVSKVTHRQSARIHGVTRKTIERRVLRLGQIAREFHEVVLARAEGTLPAATTTWSLDEQETFEEDRKICPVTVPVLIEAERLFVVHAAAGTLASRGKLTEREKERKREREKREGKRRSQSRKKVTECFEALAPLLEKGAKPHVVTDMKATYPEIVRDTLGEEVKHQQVSSKARRDTRNPLFPINVTLAMTRDGLSRLVRRNWGHSKRRARLRRHLWTWIAWRNYVRVRTNRDKKRTAGMALGVVAKRYAIPDLFRWVPSLVGELCLR